MEINLTSALNVEEDSGKSLILKPIWLFIQEKLPLNVHYVIRNLNLPQRNIITNVLQDNHKHSVPECGFEMLKTYQAPAHIWDLPR